MRPAPDPWAIHPGLRTRFVSAGERIAWTPILTLESGPNVRRARVAHALEEEARVEEWGSEADGGVMVESSPLGALVLMLAVDRRGLPPGSARSTRDATRASRAGRSWRSGGQDRFPRTSVPGPPTWSTWPATRWSNLAPNAYIS